MTQNGQPDNARSARYVLKDFVNGRLLYCVAPPTLEQERFHTFPPRRRVFSANRHIPPRAARMNKGSEITEEEFNHVFFQDKSSGVHVKGVPGGRHMPQPSLSTYVPKKHPFYIAKLFTLYYHLLSVYLILRRVNVVSNVSSAVCPSIHYKTTHC